MQSERPAWRRARPDRALAGAYGGAALGGAAFADTGKHAACLAMTILAVLALLCYLAGLFVLGQERRDEAAWQTGDGDG